jgi:hypothetical protein
MAKLIKEDRISFLDNFEKHFWRKLYQ